MPLAVTDAGHGTGWIGHISHFITACPRRSPSGERASCSGAHDLGGVDLGGSWSGSWLLLCWRPGTGARATEPRWAAWWRHRVVRAVPARLAGTRLLPVAQRHARAGAGCRAVGMACRRRARGCSARVMAALLSVFGYAAVNVQSHPYLQRPNWRSVARALGTPRRTRAILATGGTSAYPLAVYLRGVGWLQPLHHSAWIREVDVVGATKRFALVPDRDRVSRHDVYGPGAVSESGSALPEKVAPRGSILISRFPVHNWMVARFLLLHPLHISVARLPSIADAILPGRAAGSY